MQILDEFFADASKKKGDTLDLYPNLVRQKAMREHLQRRGFDEEVRAYMNLSRRPMRAAVEAAKAREFKKGEVSSGDPDTIRSRTQTYLDHYMLFDGTRLGDATRPVLAKDTDRLKMQANGLGRRIDFQTALLAKLRDDTTPVRHIFREEEVERLHDRYFDREGEGVYPM